MVETKKILMVVIMACFLSMSYNGVQAQDAGIEGIIDDVTSGAAAAVTNLLPMISQDSVDLVCGFIHYCLHWALVCTPMHIMEVYAANPAGFNGAIEVMLLLVILPCICCWLTPGINCICVAYNLLGTCEFALCCGYIWGTSQGVSPERIEKQELTEAAAAAGAAAGAIAAQEAAK